MQLYSKQALVLGGIYALLEPPLILIQNDITSLFSGLLFVLFILILLGLCFNKSPKCINYILNKHPKCSVYLIALGWIPYILLLTALLLYISGYFIEYSSKFLDNLMTYMQVLIGAFYIISIIVATLKIRKFPL